MLALWALLVQIGNRRWLNYKCKRRMIPFLRSETKKRLKNKDNLRRKKNMQLNFSFKCKWKKQNNREHKNCVRRLVIYLINDLQSIRILPSIIISLQNKYKNTRSLCKMFSKTTIGTSCMIRWVTIWLQSRTNLKTQVSICWMSNSTKNMLFKTDKPISTHKKSNQSPVKDSRLKTVRKNTEGSLKFKWRN